ncbi:MAG TPA: hypothetical protein DGG95_01025, partial [Cytophagales bacterium]|nr:hypothetical protein [Cytophagales bacterium]
MAKSSMTAGETSLQAIANKVTEVTMLKVSLAPQTDTSFMLKAPLIHPMQALENCYQKVIREAVRLEKNPEKHRDVVSSKLNEYFLLDAGEPGLINSPEGSDAMLEESFQTASELLSKIKYIAKTSIDSNMVITAEEMSEIKNQLQLVMSTCQNVVAEFEEIRLTMGVDIESISILSEASNYLKNALVEMNSITDWKSILALTIGNLRNAMGLLERMLEGLACVQIFHVIDTFYLYRLLVRYRIESNDPISAEDKMKVSSELTGILNNGNPEAKDRSWLADWLKEKMRNIDSDLKQLGDIHFHLKGGRALEYVRRLPENGRNDWDTSALINPELSAEQWYSKFTSLHNLLVLRLRRYKREYFVLINKHADYLLETLDVKPNEQPEMNPDANLFEDDELEAAAEEFDEIDLRVAKVNANSQSDDDYLPSLKNREMFFPKDSVGCKAELIDIGIPRRDTVQAFSHWHHIGPGIIRKEWTANIPVPDHRYYIDEYLMMIRDAFEVPAKKLEKRISRLASFLTLGAEDNDPICNMDTVIQHARTLVSEAGLNKSLAAIAKEPIAVQRMMTILFEEFVMAYELDKRPGLRGSFDDFVAKISATPGTMEQYIGAYPDCINDALVHLTDNDKVVLKWIAFSQALSNTFQAHLREKASVFGFGLNLSTGLKPIGSALERSTALKHFIKWLYSESVFNPADELEVQFAIAGSFAAFLHADYASTRLPADFIKQLEEELDPVDVIEIKVFCHPIRLKDAKPDIVWESLFETPLKSYCEQYNPPFDIQRDGNTAYIVWRENISIGEMSYKPLVARIRIVTEGWPQLSYVWGYPVLSLSDLIQEYFLKAGTQTEEFKTVKSLSQTANLLKGILTYFEAGELND